MFLNILLSITIHIFIVLVLFNKVVFVKPQKNIAIETNIVMKSKKSKERNLLPKKIEPSPAPPLTPKKVITKKETKTNYLEALKNLSDDFKKEIVEEKNIAQNEEIDISYYDQIYTLIKQSFVVPPHVLGPRGDGLMALIKIFLDQNGRLIKAELKRGSLDDHFNKAVLDGINRVHDFGIPPVSLQKSIVKDGILVELCPNKCPKH